MNAAVRPSSNASATSEHARRSILFILPTLAAGGAERVVVTLLRRLDRSRFRLALAVVSLKRAAFLDEVPKDVELINLGGRRVLATLPAIVRLIRNRRPDVVFSTLGHLNLALASIRPMLPNDVRYVAREASIVSENIRDELFPWLWAFAFRRVYRRFDAVICQSKWMRDDLVEQACELLRPRRERVRRQRRLQERRAEQPRVHVEGDVVTGRRGVLHDVEAAVHLRLAAARHEVVVAPRDELAARRKSEHVEAHRVVLLEAKEQPGVEIGLGERGLDFGDAVHQHAGIS